MYNEFDPKHYKGKWPCTTKTLYNEKTLIGRLHQYFLIYFETFSVPTADTLFLLILSILILEYAHSIRFLYQHFLSRITEKSLNVFYYACSYAKVDYSRFMNTTVRIALKLIPDSLQPPWSGRLCLNFTAKIMSSSFVTAGILCHFREKYRNTYKIKCYNKGLKTDDSLTSLSFIKL